MECPIRNEQLWDKVKNLTGTDDEVRRLNEVNAKGLLTADEYWTIKAKWAANKSRQKNENSQPDPSTIKNPYGD